MLDDVTPSPDAARPCWWAGPAEACSSNGTPGFALTVERSDDPPVGSYVSSFCVGSCQ